LFFWLDGAVTTELCTRHLWLLSMRSHSTAAPANACTTHTHTHAHTCTHTHTLPVLASDLYASFPPTRRLTRTRSAPLASRPRTLCPVPFGRWVRVTTPSTGWHRLTASCTRCLTSDSRHNWSTHSLTHSLLHGAACARSQSRRCRNTKRTQTRLDVKQTNKRVCDGMMMCHAACVYSLPCALCVVVRLVEETVCPQSCGHVMCSYFVSLRYASAPVDIDGLGRP
jgi:hypothetical protein